ncbi:MAG: hypothetical protein LUO93_02840 [Methanomicrobiales archaeon]|nr:hypothetical protein [Methanomicrobiales archaeon]
MKENPRGIFQKEAPDVAKAFNDLIRTLVASKGLDQKTKQLIYIANESGDGRRYSGAGSCTNGKTGRCHKGRGG